MATTQPFRDRLPNSALGPLLKRLTSEPFSVGTVGNNNLTKKKMNLMFN